MFTNLKNILAQVVAPINEKLTPLETLMAHYNHIEAYYAKSDVQYRLIAHTNIPIHVDGIRKYLKEQDCMEFFLSHQIFAYLVEKALQNNPVGMDVLVCKFTSSLLGTQRNAQLLPEESFRSPLEQLLRHCDQKLHAQDNQELLWELVKLINALSKQFELNPPLLILFFKETGEFELFDLILSYSFDITNKEVVLTASREALLIVIGVVCSQYYSNANIQSQYQRYISQSKLSNHIVDIFTELFVKVSAVIDSSQSLDEVKSDYDIPRLFDYILFIIDLLNVSSAKDRIGEEYLIAHTLIEAFKQEMLRNIVFKKIMLVLSSDSVKYQTRQRLWLDFLAGFILEIGGTELLMAPFLDCFIDTQLSDKLYKYCQSEEQLISIHAWKVFDALFTTYNSSVYTRLVLHPIFTESLDGGTSSQIVNIRRQSSLQKIIQKILLQSPPSQLQMRPDSPFKLIVDDYERKDKDLKSQEGQDLVVPNSRDIDSYLEEAYVKSVHCFRIVNHWNLTIDASPSRETFDILELIMEKFMTFYRNSPALNLVLTSILSNLAMIPQRQIQNWILSIEDQVDVKSPVLQHSIVQTLLKVLQESQSLKESIPDFKQRLEQWNSNPKHGNAEEDSLLYNYMILMEFSKELCSILFIVNRTLNMIEKYDKQQQ
ncbi:hypothetical protein MP228_002816 [Amoeboaphelidium protococcarum]|nr:hypothetical protein MP228_002816 [Amoeboaphelidium protococcarum]